MAGEYGVHPSQIKKWKKIAIDGIMELFADRRRRKDKEKRLPAQQGSQFTSIDFIEKLKQRRVQISMDGRGKLEAIFLPGP